MTDKPKPAPVAPQPAPPDWLTAQAKAVATYRPKKPQRAYRKRHWP